MEIAAFVTGGIVALAGRAVVVSVAASHAQPAQPPPPPPPPPPMSFKKPRVRARSHVIPADFDFTQSYIGLNRCEKEEEQGGVTISKPIEVTMSRSAPTFVKDPELLNQTRLRHVDVVRPQIPDRNDSEICRLLGEGKTKLKSVL